VAELKKLQQRRLKVTFVDDDADDNSTRAMQRQIEGLTGDITEVSPCHRYYAQVGSCK